MRQDPQLEVVFNGVPERLPARVSQKGLRMSIPNELKIDG